VADYTDLGRGGKDKPHKAALLKMLHSQTATPSWTPDPTREGSFLGKTSPRSVLTAGMLPLVLIRERTSLQPTSISD